MYWAKDMLFKIVLPVAIQNFFIAYIAHIVFLLDSTVLEYSLVFFFFSLVIWTFLKKPSQLSAEGPKI